MRSLRSTQRHGRMTRLRSGLVYWPEGQGYGAYRQKDRRSRRVGFVAADLIDAALVAGQLLRTPEGWLVGAEGFDAEGAVPSAEALCAGAAPVLRQSAFARLLGAMQEDDPVRARRWAQASVRWLADYEAISRSSLRTMDWSPVARSAGHSGAGWRAPVSYGRWRAGETMRLLTKCVGLAGMNDLTRLFVGTSSVTALARDLGLSRSAVEARLVARLDALCAAYDEVLASEDPG